MPSITFDITEYLQIVLTVDLTGKMDLFYQIIIVKLNRKIECYHKTILYLYYQNI